jgi:hypothetical protein
MRQALDGLRDGRAMPGHPAQSVAGCRLRTPVHCDGAKTCCDWRRYGSVTTALVASGLAIDAITADELAVGPR